MCLQTGLLIGKQMKNWDKNGDLKLSNVLEMYYSEAGVHGDNTFRACNRLNHYRETIDKNMLKEQVLFTTCTISS